MLDDTFTQRKVYDAKVGAWIVEDEYDAEYRYRGRSVAALLEWA